jgi:hypothetical protein
MQTWSWQLDKETQWNDKLLINYINNSVFYVFHFADHQLKICVRRSQRHELAWTPKTYNPLVYSHLESFFGVATTFTDLQDLSIETVVKCKA